MPVKGNKLYCPVCGHEQSQINKVACERCGSGLGAPNVNEVSTEDEINALDARYNNAKDFLLANGKQAALDAFEEYFKSKVQAVINIRLEPLTVWLLTNDTYRNYYRLVKDGIRAVATPENDRKRGIIDSFLFGGSFIDKIVFAALSLKNEGLKSYRNCTVSLDESIIIPWLTVLEENSYNFAERHGINLEQVEIPKGYRTIWNNKLKLAVAKLHVQIEIDCTEDHFCDIVLYSDGKREDEEYLELHIYNELSAYAVNNAYIPKPANRKLLFDVKKIKAKYPGKVFVV